mgnify:CR=1 FL=1
MSFAAQAHGTRPVFMKGTVTDENSGEAIPGAVISIERNGQVIHSVETDLKGDFSLNYEINYLPSDEFKVSIYKKGYRIQKMKTLHCEKESITIEMEKKPKFAPLILPSTTRLQYDI